MNITQITPKMYQEMGDPLRNDFHFYIVAFNGIPPEYVNGILGFNLLAGDDDLSDFKYQLISIEGQVCYLEWREYPQQALCCAVSKNLSVEEKNKIKDNLVELFQLNPTWISPHI